MDTDLDEEGTWADVAEFELVNDVGGFHGAVESGVLVGGESCVPWDGKTFDASQAVTFLGDEAVVKLDFRVVNGYAVERRWMRLRWLLMRETGWWAGWSTPTVKIVSGKAPGAF
jgi:hypothetical protein